MPFKKLLSYSETKVFVLSKISAWHVKSGRPGTKPEEGVDRQFGEIPSLFI